MEKKKTVSLYKHVRAGENNCNYVLLYLGGLCFISLLHYGKKKKDNLLWPTLHLSLEAASSGSACIFDLITQTAISILTIWDVQH